MFFSPKIFIKCFFRDSRRKSNVKLTSKSTVFQNETKFSKDENEEEVILTQQTDTDPSARILAQVGFFIFQFELTPTLADRVCKDPRS